jgi:hypothetical protein
MGVLIFTQELTETEIVKPIVVTSRVSSGV